ncbi:hypothetical protein Q3G72_031301 [Acer saccharum]|nr:hypothetical protein Q3G72_031301 [Acer saccharum]
MKGAEQDDEAVGDKVVVEKDVGGKATGDKAAVEGDVGGKAVGYKAVVDGDVGGKVAVKVDVGDKAVVKEDVGGKAASDKAAIKEDVEEVGEQQDVAFVGKAIEEDDAFVVDAGNQSVISGE